MASSYEYTSWFPSYSELPMEIILHIFRFLDHSDLQAAGATCQRWREAVHDSEFHSNTLVRFEKIFLADRLPPACIFINSDRPFLYFRMEEVTFGQVDEFMSHIGQNAVELTFDNVDLGDKQFYAMMRHFPNLRRLSVTRCSPLFMSGSFLDNNDDRLIVDLTFSNIKHLSLSNNQYLSDAILLRLTALIRGIESLDCSGCHIAYHNAIHRRFYPNDMTVSPSESILTFKFLLRVLGLHRPYLHDLNLSHTMISGGALVALGDLEFGGLHLLRLRLAGCRQLNVVGLKTFLTTQPQLVLLDLSDINCINDDCIGAIVLSTPKLEHLNVAGCSHITNNGAALLGTLKHLSQLDISRCEGITTEGIRQGIARTKNTTFHELIMDHMQICEEGIKLIAQNLQELRVLNLGFCVNGVSDDTVQCIIKNLRWLRELSLEDCFRITDAALTGINVSQLDVKPPSSGSLENFHPPPTNSLAERESLFNSMQSLKISLRSKAEEDIIRDANRKRAMFAAYELNLIDPKDIEGCCIKELRGLKTLNLKGCNKITDVSLKYGFEFRELKRLSLSNCQQISLVGMDTLVLNCPSIEELDLSDCYNIDDKTIKALTAKLTRLRSLHISGCTQLTDHSVDAILVNCKNLQTLSVYRCRRMYTDIEDRLSKLPTLRNLNMDNTGNIENAEIFRLKKRLDY